MNRKESKHRPGTATLEKGRVRLIAILEAARQVFMRHGYAGFTMRKVAAEAGISVGNLHYYYRNKEDLLRDMLDYVVSHYLEEFDNRMKLAGDAPDQQLGAIIAFLIEDLNRVSTTRFFPELWALGNHDEYAAELMEAMYARARAPMSRLIARMRPELSQGECDEMALLFSASIEGLTMFVGHDKPWAEHIDAIKALALQAFLDLARGPPRRKRS